MLFKNIRVIIIQLINVYISSNILPILKFSTFLTLILPFIEPKMDLVTKFLDDSKTFFP